MRSKIRLFFLLLAVLCCVMAFSVTAMASDEGCYASNENTVERPPEAIDQISISTSAVSVSDDTGSKPLTPDGNLTLVDDILQDESCTVQDEQVVRNKQFITVQSKNGNTFYIVIDRSDNSENVYFLNLVDEADLEALIEEEEAPSEPVCICQNHCEVGSINTDCPVCKTNLTECMGKEPVREDDETETEPEKEDSQKNSQKGTETKEETETKASAAPVTVALLLILGSGGAFYWFRFRKKKTGNAGNTDLDEYDFGEDAEDEQEENEAETENNENEGEKTE